MIAVLGGGSAFTPALALALAEAASSLPPLLIRLHGRDASRTADVAACCERLARGAGASQHYESCPSLEVAARGAAVVVNQMRVGGWAGRTHDERFPLAHGLPGDETIGPGGVASALRTLPVVLRAAHVCASAAPGCWFVNLSNPMGIVLAALADVPGVRALGLCELPGETLRRALALLPEDRAPVQVDYLGLNHQGWFTRIERGGRDLLPDVAAALARAEATHAPEAEFFGVDAELVEMRHALPLPYMRLYEHREREVAALRARHVARGDELRALSDALHAACAAGTEVGDAGLRALLARRRTSWLPDALVPALAALLGGPPAELYVSQPNRGHIAALPAEAIVEQRCLVDGEGARALPWLPAPLSDPADDARQAARLELLHRIARFEAEACRAACAADPESARSAALRALAEHPFDIAPATAQAMLGDLFAPLQGAGPAVACNSAALDALADSDVEQRLMASVRGGQLSAAALRTALPSFPLKLQLQTSSPCNASCVMCPWPDTRSTQPQGLMSEELFDRIVAQLAGRGVLRTSLFLMNEPLLDRRLERLTARLKQRVPETTALIFTNGSGLSAARALALADAGMDEINVSVVGFDRESYAQIMRDIDYDVVLSHLEAVGSLATAGRLGRMAVRVVGLQFERALEGLEAFRERVGLPVFLKPVSNRAGLVDLDELHPTTARAARFSACQRPFVKAYVLYNGDLVLCNCDWERTTVIGNLAERSLEDLWTDRRLMAIREQHCSGELERHSLCARCDYPWLA